MQIPSIRNVHPYINFASIQATIEIIFRMTKQLITIKVGTHVITKSNGFPDEEVISSISNQISNLKKKGYQVVLISSGAVAAGRSIFSFKKLPDTIEQRQVLSSIGQVELISRYKKAFDISGVQCSQVLVTKEDFKSRTHYLNMKNCLLALLKNDIVPIINENDVVSVTELMFTDNDELAGLVSAMINTDILLMLTNVEGIYSGDPSNKDSFVIPVFEKGAVQFENITSTQKSEFGRGGVITKCNIAEKIAGMGIPVRIANGHADNIILRTVEDEMAPGTFFPAKKTASSIKKYIAHAYETKGIVSVNEGAARALSSNKASSLLPVGLMGVYGKFKKGDIIRIEDEKGKEIGMGLARYSAKKAIKFIGEKNRKPLIHYDHLYLH